MSENVAVDLVGALVQQIGSVADDWNSLSMVLQFTDDYLSGTYGFVYSADGEGSSVAASPWRIKEAVTAYMRSYYQPGDAYPVKMLVQYDRSAGKYEVTFEDTDVLRWKLTPENFYELPEELRPKFD